jgi:hypothetical protein
VSLIEIEIFEEHCSKAEKVTLRLLRLILNNQEKIMSQLDDLNTLLDGISSTLSTVAADAQTIESDLAALQAVNPGIDLTGVLAKAQAIQLGLSALDDGLKAAAAPPTTATSLVDGSGDTTAPAV